MSEPDPVPDRNGQQDTRETEVTHQAEVVHSTRGRTRVRLAPESRNPQVLATVKAHLEVQEGVHEVVVRERSGSVVVKYDHTVHAEADVLEMFEDVGVIAGEVLGVDEEEGEAKEEANRIAKAVRDLNTIVYRRTGRRLHLGLFAIGGLTLFGVRQTALYGLGLEFIPGPLALYMAYYLIRHRDRLRPAVDGDDVEGAETDDLESLLSDALPSTDQVMGMLGGVDPQKA
jgi:hypothetical protein